MASLLAFAAAALAKPMPRIGLLGWTSCDTSMAQNGEWAFLLKGLAEFGYRPQDNVAIDCRSANGKFEQFKPSARELAEIPVDIIVANSDPATQAASLATHAIPIIGLQAAIYGNSFAAPEINITGIVEFNIELTGKRLEILKEAIPSLKHIAVLSNSVGFYRDHEARINRAGQELQTGLTFFRVKEADALDEVFAEMKAENVDAVFVLPSLMFAANASRIADLASKNGLATMVWDDRLTKAGCLMSYSAKVDDMEQRLAYFVDRILKGRKAGVIPIERPSRFVLAINLRTAGALGLSLPRSLLMMADEVVE